MAVRAEAEREGYERAALAYREQAEVLRCDMESRHEGDLDALSEEAVRATNRLKAKLSAMELKHSQVEESRTQFLEGEEEMRKMKERIREVEEILRAQEEVYSDSKTNTQLESAREVGMVTLKMEGFREKIQAECDTLRQSEKQANKALELQKKESDKILFDINLQNEAFAEGLQRQLLDSSLVNARLRHDLQTQHEFSRTLQGDVDSCREASVLVSELSEKLKKSSKEMTEVKAEKIKIETAMNTLEKRAISMESDSQTSAGLLSTLQETLKAEKEKRYSFLSIKSY
jgi:DNA repair exonuclease SbcCD ATPase subunit